MILSPSGLRILCVESLSENANEANSREDSDQPITDHRAAANPSDKIMEGEIMWRMGSFYPA
jgi:hypothetical protein